MFNYAGFYEPATEGTGPEAGESTGKPLDFGQLFALITDRTGWTPKQIGELTLEQLKIYLNAWTGKPEDEASDLTPEGIRRFNLFAGIPQKVIRKPSKSDGN